jgi:hypothetical protein
MAGANIFIMYAASDTNVTISPCSGKGEFQPLFNSDARVTLLDGSGISNGVMTANIRCDNCLSWNGGSMNPTDPASSWIWSVKRGSAIDSTSQMENLQQHDVSGAFTFDLTKATGGESSNPFVSSSSSSPTSSGASPSATSSSDDSNSDSNSDSSGSSAISQFSRSTVDQKRKAHAAVMSAAFVVFFPTAALVIRLPLKIAAVPLIHAPIQLLGLALIISGLGIGVSLAQDTGNISNPVQEHVVIGIIVVSTLVLFQPAMGMLQHLHYRKTGGKSVFAYCHRWLGRCMILLGMINGGLGLRLARRVAGDAPNSAIIAYSVVAGVVAIVYLLTIVWSSARRVRTTDTNHTNLGRRKGEKIAMHRMNGQVESGNQGGAMSSESGTGLVRDDRYS